MSKITQFQSSQEAALLSFVSQMQRSNVLSVAMVQFDDDKWDLSLVTKQALNTHTRSLAFKDYASPPGLKAAPLPGDFLLVSKALVVDRIEQKQPAKQHYNLPHATVAAIQKLENEMRADGKSSILNCTEEYLNRAVENYGKDGGKYGRAVELRLVIRRLAELGILPDLAAWDHPITSRRTVIGSRIVRHGNRENLTNDEAYAIAELFHLAEEPRDVFYSSLLALMCCAPCRIAEVGALPVDVEVVQEPMVEGGARFKYGLRWWPVKGGEPQVKFVPKEMVPVAERAVRQLKDLTDDARSIAKQTIVTDQIPLPEKLEHVREKGVVTATEAATILGIKKLTKSMLSCFQKVAYATYSFESLEQYWRERLPQHWPVVSELTKITYDECLTTHFVNQFNDLYTRRCLVVGFAPADLGRELTPKSKDHENIFERNGVFLPDGSVPQITTHQIRHYLNTIAQRANVPQAHIAKWSGRKLIMQNEDYDHTDLEDVVQSILNNDDHVDTGISVPEIVDDSPDNVDYLEALVRQSIHSTPFGFCTSNLRTSPCDRAGACTTCTKLICIAGHKDHGPAIRADVERRRIAVENIREREAAGRRVNPAMKEAMEAQLAHTETLLNVIEDPANNGSFISNAEAQELVEFSHQQRVFEARKNVELVK